jgi:hypothetical protein
MLCILALGTVLVMQGRAISSIQSATALPSTPATHDEAARFDPFAPSVGSVPSQTLENTIVVQRGSDGEPLAENSLNSLAEPTVPSVLFSPSQSTAKTTASGTGQSYAGSAAESELVSRAFDSSNVISVPTAYIDVGVATINVGTADINVSSSFRLFYGGTLVASGQNGQITP